MSVWTHINGAIRIDAIPGLDRLWKKEIKNKLGVIVNFDSSEEIWNLPDKQITPKGSEGGIKYDIYINGEENSLSRGTICIYGDLRDFYNDDVNKIFEWLKRLESLENCYIRQGIVQVNIATGEKYIFTWNDDIEKWENNNEV